MGKNHRKPKATANSSSSSNSSSTTNSPAEPPTSSSTHLASSPPNPSPVATPPHINDPVNLCTPTAVPPPITNKTNTVRYVAGRPDMSLDATAPSFTPTGAVAPPLSTHKHALDDSSAPAEPDAKRAREQEATRFDFPGPVAERFLSGGGEELKRQVKVLQQRVENLENECKKNCKPEEKKKYCEGVEKAREEPEVAEVKREEGRELKKWKKVLVREEEELNIWRMVLVSSVCVTCAVLGGFVGAMAERGWVKGRFVDAAWSSVKGN